MRRITTFGIVIIIVLCLAITAVATSPLWLNKLGAKANGGQQPENTEVLQPPVAPATEVPVDIDKGIPPEAIPNIPVGVYSEKLPISAFIEMWNSTRDTESPGTLMILLDEAYGAYTDGEAQKTGRWADKDSGFPIPSGSIVWTNTQGVQWTLTATGAVADATQVKMLKCEGFHCVWYVYADVTSPTPGRAWQTDKFLNPEEDLPGWVK